MMTPKNTPLRMLLPLLLTRAALSICGRAKSKFLSVSRMHNAINILYTYNSTLFDVEAA